MLRIFNRWLTCIVLLAIVAGCGRATPTPTLAPTVEPTTPIARPASPSPSPHAPTATPMMKSTATRTPTATSTRTLSPSPRPATQTPTATRTPVPSPVPASLPTATPDPAPWSGCGHPYFPLPDQGYWRYAVTTRHGDAEPAPQAAQEMRVVSIGSDAGHTVATINYAPILSWEGHVTTSMDCTAPAASGGGRCSSSSDPLPLHFYRSLPPAEELVPGYSWSGCSNSIWGSSGGHRYSTGYAVIAAEPVLFQGQWYEGLKIRQVEIEGTIPGGGVTIYNRVTGEAKKSYTIELARGIGIVRRVADGAAPCIADAPTPRELAEGCDSINLTVNYELLEFGSPTHTAQPVPSPTAGAMPTPSAATVWLQRLPGLDYGARNPSCVWSPAGAGLLAADSTGALLFDPQTLRFKYQLNTQAGVTSAAFSLDGRFLATATYSNTVQVWDGTGQQLLRTIEDPSRQTQSPLYMPGVINSLAFSPDGALLVASIAGDYDGGHGSLWMWKTETGERLGIARTSGVVLQVQFSPDGTMLASAERGETYARGGDGLVLWDARTLQPLRTLCDPEGAPGTSENAMGLAFHPQPGRPLIAAVGTTLAEAGIGVGARVAICNVDSGACWRLAQPAGATCVAYSPDGALLAVGTREGTIRIWDGSGSRLLATLQEHTSAVWGVAFSPDGRKLVSWDTSGVRLLWEQS